MAQPLYTNDVAFRGQTLKTVANARCTRDVLLYIGLSNRIFATAECRGERGTGGYMGRSIARIGRYDIIVTNTESILYYCTSIFVIINPNRVTRGNETRGGSIEECATKEDKKEENTHKKNKREETGEAE